MKIRYQEINPDLFSTLIKLLGIDSIVLEPRGVLAFDRDKAVAWCSFEAEENIPAFYIKKEYGKLGVGEELILHTLKVLRRKAIKPLNELVRTLDLIHP